jgi:hypothetical protein
MPQGRENIDKDGDSRQELFTVWEFETRVWSPRPATADCGRGQKGEKGKRGRNTVMLYFLFFTTVATPEPQYVHCPTVCPRSCGKGRRLAIFQGCKWKNPFRIRLAEVVIRSWDIPGIGPRFQILP